LIYNMPIIQDDLTGQEMWDEECGKIRDDINNKNYSEEECVQVHMRSVWALWARKQQEIRVERLRQFELLQEHSRYGSVPVVFPCDDDPLTSRDAIINIFEVESSDTIINVAKESEDEDEMDDDQDDHPIASSDSISDISESEEETDDDEEEDEMHPMDDGLYYDV
jgi:hypothetical protein